MINPLAVTVIDEIESALCVCTPKQQREEDWKARAADRWPPCRVHQLCDRLRLALGIKQVGIG